LTAAAKPVPVTAVAGKLLIVKKLTVNLHQGSHLKQRGQIRAVDGVSCCLEAGESFGLMGESGCGKTSLGKAVAGIIRPDKGEILFKGEPVRAGRFRPEIQMVFQDPHGSLNPRIKIRSQLMEGLRNYRIGDRDERDGRLKEIAEEVQLPKSSLELPPQHLSGGQKQRAALARAILLKPELLILDEPTSSLDGITRKRILTLLAALTAKHHVSSLVISHDLAMLQHLCRRVAVMYLGRLVETGSSEQVFFTPAHYYTRLLLDAYLPPQPGLKRISALVPKEINTCQKIPAGCRFYPRCPRAELLCRTTVPALRQIGENHWCACHRAG